MVNRVLRLGDRTVDSVMTPRTRIAWLDAKAPIEHNLQVMRDTPYSRYPVYRGGEQEVLGVLEAKRLVGQIGASGQTELFKSLRKPLYVPATARALDLLEEFRDAETALALVVDEYGDIEGLVTLNDLLAAVVGKSATPLIETRRTADRAARRRQLARRRQRIDAMICASCWALRNCPTRKTTISALPPACSWRTSAAFRRPANISAWNGFRFEVVDLDGPRIDKLLVERVPGQRTE